MRQIGKNIYSVGAVDWVRRLFDELIPLPDGTSYNSYLVKGSKATALIDGVDPARHEDLLENIIDSEITNLDYIICNHAEQDHSGAIEDLAVLYPQAKVVTNEKCKGFLMDLLDLTQDRFKVIEDGETLSLGNKTLKFIFTPWVHWPETMCTYLVEDKILFSCDFFGSHLATAELFVKNEQAVYEPAKRYYAEIMMPFRSNIEKNIAKVTAEKIEMIAPSHGPIYQNPQFIINCYKDWGADKFVNRVMIPFVSMHESTAVMVYYFAKALMQRNVEVKLFNMSSADVGQLAITLVDTPTLIVGSPQVLGGAHPAVANAVFLANALRPKTKFAGIIGSYGWGGKMVEQIKGMMEHFKAELFEPVIAKGLPKNDDYKNLDLLADKIVEKHKALGIA